MKNTKVYATIEEADEIGEKWQQALKTPVITFNINEPDAANTARRQVSERIQELALSHGLPEIKGYYGIDLKSREFLYNE